MSILKVTDLKKTYRIGFWKKSTPILKGVNFEIQGGTITGFLGKNGSGKTTTIKCLLGLALPDSGKVEFFGTQELTPEVKSQIGFLPERPYFYEYLTGEEFLRFYGEISTRLSPRDLSRRISELLERVELLHAKDKQLRSYSKGMLQRIGIAQALIHDPKFIILDEPMSGLDPDGRLKVNQIIRETAERGTTVFFSSHLLHDAEMICEQLVIMKDGQVLLQGPMNQLLDRMQKGFSISFLKEQKIVREVITTSDQLQKRIDELRLSRSNILEIRKERPSLEEAFVAVSQNGGL